MTGKRLERAGGAAKVPIAGTNLLRVDSARNDLGDGAMKLARGAALGAVAMAFCDGSLGGTLVGRRQGSGEAGLTRLGSPAVAIATGHLEFCRRSR